MPVERFLSRLRLLKACSLHARHFTVSVTYKRQILQQKSMRQTLTADTWCYVTNPSGIYCAAASVAHKVKMQEVKDRLGRLKDEADVICHDTSKMMSRMQTLGASS